MLRLSSIVRIVGITCAILIAPQASAIDLFKDTQPQATTNTCQSYAVMLALAAQDDPSFPIENFQHLREAEANFRAIAESKKGGPYGHKALKAAIEDYTNGKYTLQIETINTGIVDWLARVKELTVFSSSADVMISQLSGSSFPVILTSVDRFGGNSYGSGHIITVLGIAGTGLDSTTEIIAFNSAIKGSGSINTCQPGDQPGDMRYTAGVVSTKDYLLKEFGGGLRLLFLQKK